MRTIVKRGSVELKTVAEADAFLSADDNCVLGKFSVDQPCLSIHVSLPLDKTRRMSGFAGHKILCKRSHPVSLSMNK